MRTVDIVIKSYPDDYGWLAYCLRSINKFCRGFNRVIVMLPRSAPLTLTAETVILLDSPEGYLQQQVAKLNADLHTQADYIVHFDSDTIITGPLTPDYFFRDGKPLWVMSPFDDHTKKVWYHVMAKCLQDAPPFEFMRRQGIVAPRGLYGKFRSFIERTHGVPMEQYVTTQNGHEFSEFNCIGMYAWLFHREVFSWLNTAEEEVPQWPWKQHWSWGGLTPEVREEIEEVLK